MTPGILANYYLSSELQADVIPWKKSMVSTQETIVLELEEDEEGLARLDDLFAPCSEDVLDAER